MSIKENTILFTGGSGLLGTELRQIFPDAFFPDSKEFDVTDYDGMVSYLEPLGVTSVVHAAAFTSPPKVEQDPAKALQVNIIGTANIVRICMERNIKLVYISTDYVFDGEKGEYSEEEPLNPVNKYAWSKLGGECAVRLYPNSLIVRTTFGPNIFPYDKAFFDQWTSRESVRIIASMIRKIIFRTEVTGVLHVGGERKTVYEYAHRLSPEKNISAISIHDMSFAIPKDTSLNVDRFKHLFDIS